MQSYQNNRPLSTALIENGNNSVFLTEPEMVELIPINENNRQRKIISSRLESCIYPIVLNEKGGLDHASLKKQKINMGSEEVKRHKWFIDITDWNQVYERKLKPPFVPKVLHEGDTQNFEKYDSIDFSKIPYATENQLDHFKDF